MQPAAGPPAEQFAVLRVIDSEYAFCQSVISGENETHDEHFRPLIASLATEGEALAVTPTRWRVANWLRRNAARPGHAGHKP